MKKIAPPSWGNVQKIIKVADGITFIQGESHSGYKVSGYKLEAIQPRYRLWNESLKGGFYESEIDWAMIALSFPDFFSEDEVSKAEYLAQDSRIAFQSRLRVSRVLS